MVGTKAAAVQRKRSKRIAAIQNLYGSHQLNAQPRTWKSKGFGETKEGEPRMLPFRGILCTTDFSEAAEKGVKAAEELARHFDADLYLLHVVSPLPTMPGGLAPTGFHIPSVLEEIKESAMASLKQQIKRETSKRLSITPMAIIGDPATEITRRAKELKADLIVIATHGQSGLKKFVSGSVAEKVLRMSHCPVLSVGDGA
jgi:nucleotide-binding universal stress UspA family protein